MDILGLDKIRHIEDNDNESADIDMTIHSDDISEVAGLDKIRQIFHNDFPRISVFATELIELVRRTGELDPECRQFGADKHKYRFNPVVPLQSVRDFERRHCIRLPQGYVDFLTQVGNGGAGPDFGLYSLEELEYHNYLHHTDRIVNDNMIMGEDDYYTSPYIFPQHPVLMDSSLTEEKWELFSNELYRLREENREEEYRQKRMTAFNGILEIVDSGYSSCVVLICEGDMCGEVSSFSRDYDMPHYKYMTFEDWVTDHFESVINRFSTSG